MKYFKQAPTRPKAWSPKRRRWSLHEAIAKHLAPSDEQFRRSLWRTKAVLRCDWTQLASLMGVTNAEMSNWVNDHRPPSGTARKLAWLLESMARDHARADSWTKILTWGVVERGWRGGRRGRGDEISQALTELENAIIDGINSKMPSDETPDSIAIPRLNRLENAQLECEQAFARIRALTESYVQ